MNGHVAPTLASLKAMAPEKIYEAISSGGKMQTQASALTDRDKRNVAEFLTGRNLADATERKHAEDDQRMFLQPGLARAPD